MPADTLQIVDARGMACPMPTVRLAQTIRTIKIGDVVELWTDDVGSQQNMRVWTKNTGHELISATTEGTVYKYQVRRLR